MKHIGTFLWILAVMQTFAQHGRVGINTTNPQATLHIRGDVRIDSLMVGDTSSRVLALGQNNIVQTISYRTLAKAFPQEAEKIITRLPFADTIAMHDAVVVGDGLTGYMSISDFTGTNISPSPELADEHWLGQTFMASSEAIGLKAVHLRTLSGYGGGTFMVSVRATSGGNPVGSDLMGIVAEITTSYNSNGIYFVFDPPIDVVSGEQYMVVIRYFMNNTSGSYARCNGFSDNPYQGGMMFESSDSGKTWTALASNDLSIEVYETKTEKGKLYRASMLETGGRVINHDAQTFSGGNITFYSGQADLFNNFIGFALEDGYPGEVKRVQVGGKIVYPMALSPGLFHYLSNVVGGISEAPGVVNRKVGMALDSTSLIIKP